MDRMESRGASTETRSVSRRSSSARVLAVGLVLALVLGPATALASEKYTAARKCGRGAAGMLLGVLEIPGNMVKETRENGPARGFTLGFVMGIGMLVVRTLVGTYELFTSPFEIPEGFKPLIEPEYPWDYFEDEGSGGRGASDDVYESY